MAEPSEVALIRQRSTVDMAQIPSRICSDPVRFNFALGKTASRHFTDRQIRLKSGKRT